MKEESNSDFKLKNKQKKPFKGTKQNDKNKT